MKNVVVVGSFDDMRSRHIRLLDEAARLGRLHLLLWSDAAVRALTGEDPKFPQEERLYVARAIRYVDRAALVNAQSEPDGLPLLDGIHPDIWVVGASEDTPGKREFCAAHSLEYTVLNDAALAGFPAFPVDESEGEPARKKVIVTGCFDWFHSGHVRFFEEVAELGDLYVGVGNDPNVRLLKGEGHPLFTQEERRYMVQAIRHVTRALISSGMGWMDAAPDIERIRPDIYAVNEDGDKPEKREFCQAHGLEYVVLKRAPKEGLPKRTSTNLRGY